MANSRPFWMLLGVVGMLSLLTVVLSALGGWPPGVVLAAAAFAITAISVGLGFAAVSGDSESLTTVSCRFARLIAVAYGWSGAAMLGSYYLTDLSWQHAWQYGAGMLLIAGGIWWYAHLRDVGHPRVSTDGRIRTMRWLTGAQGIAAVAGVTILILSGKIQADGRDWVANIIFVAGGLCVAALSFAALAGERRASGE
ncbi:MAG: hypothetical protein KKB37_12420 [Alphaproteobacteria bacterium]|nr:hypothetical protein [Alphaproteobacteria bacterium]